MGTFIDAIPGAGTKAARAVRGTPLGGPVYSPGLIAGDQVPLDLVVRMRAAVSAASSLQRQDPEAGVARLCERFPDVRPEDARHGWSLLEPYVFSGADVGSTDHGRWGATIDWLTSTHGLPRIDPERVYRPELASSPIVVPFRESLGVLQPISR